MRNLILLLCLFPSLLFAQRDYWALVQTNCPDYEAARELRRQLVADGHLVSLIYQPQWMVARLQASPSAVREQHPQIVAVGAGPGSTRGMEAPYTLGRFFEKMAAGRFDPSVKSKTTGPPEEAFAAFSCASGEPLEKGLDGEYVLNNDFNSEYFRGIVATGVLFIESDGTEDPNYYSWTLEALEEEKLDVLMSLHTWAYTAYRHEADLTFIPVWYDSRPEVNQGFEPNLHLGSFDFYGSELSKMTGAVLSNLGYDGSWVRAQGDDFSYDLSQAYQSDFAFTIGIHYSHAGKGYIRANAMIGGPITYLSREYDYRVYGHEIGHIFHAYDEYLNTQNCDPSLVTFNGTINGNNLANDCREKQPCVMNDNAVAGSADQLYFAVCSYTVDHFGWAENVLPPAPQILSRFDEPIRWPLFQLEADFPRSRERLSGYVKVWRVEEGGRDSLIVSDDLGPVSGRVAWETSKSFLPGVYKCVFYHGQKGSYALVPSPPLTFEVDFAPAFSFRDTCFYFCRAPQPVNFPQEGLRWYGDPGLEKLLAEGGEYVPAFNIDSTVYLVKWADGAATDIVSVTFLFGRPASPGLQSRIEGDGRIALSLYSFIPIQNVQSIQWYRNDQPIPGANDWWVYVYEPGAYSATIDNGCFNYSDTFRLVLPPGVERNVLCDERGYEMVVRGENIQWYDERRNPYSTEDTLRFEHVDRYQLYLVTQTVDGVESPAVEVLLTPLTEEERIDLLNTNGYLRVKSPQPVVDWWRNDTLFLSDGPLEMTAPLPGVYRVSANNFAGCPSLSAPVEVRFSVPPPGIPQDNYTRCLRDRVDPDDFEGPVARAEGQDLRWYYEPDLSKEFNQGETYEITYFDFKSNARLFVTQTIGGEESPPAVIFTRHVFPIDLAIDSLTNALHAVVNGEDELVLPDDYIFQWYLDGDPLSGGDDEWFYPEGVGGWYTVDILNLTEGCLAADSVLINVATPVEDVPPAEQLLVYPNPAGDQFYVQFPAMGAHRLLLYNSRGQLVRQSVGADLVEEVYAGDLPPGLYVLQCRLASGRAAVRKVVVSR